MDISKAQILVFDQDAPTAQSVCEILGPSGCHLSLAVDERDALVLCEQKLFNLVFVGVEGAGAEFTTFMDRVRLQSPDTQFIFISRGGNIRAAVDAIRHGAFDYLIKPVNAGQLGEAVHKALAHQAETTEDAQLRQRLLPRVEPNIFVGDSTAMHDIQRLVEEIAPTDVTVVISGESGTGKEVVARAIHAKSRREGGPFIAVNCAALADSLIESEFFGHVKGAFTGAIKDRLGRFQLAQGGTLFLDEIGDLSAKGQGDLLRVIEDGIFRPIGSPKLVRANARIITAANKDLEKLCADGRFRDDLLYRLNIVSIHIPPLVESFTRYFCAKHQRKTKRFSARTLALFRTLTWPGNVRQLRNIVERLVVTIPRTVIEPADLPPSLVRTTPSGREFVIKPGMTIAQVETELIRQTMLRNDVSQAEAAARLGISRRALQYKIKRHGLLLKRAKIVKNWVMARS